MKPDTPRSQLSDPATEEPDTSAEGSVTASATAEDNKWSQALRHMDTPPDLEARLIAAMRAARAQAAVEEPRRSVPSPAQQGQTGRRLWLRWAAAVATAGAGVTLFSLGRREKELLSLSTLLSELGTIATEGPELGLYSGDKSEVMEWLKTAAAPAPLSLPDKIQALTRFGCQVYEVQGRRISLQCFAGPGGIIHLFSIPSAELKDPPEPQVTLFTQGSLTVATWSRDEHSMVVCTALPEAELKPLLAV